MRLNLTKPVILSAALLLFLVTVEAGVLARRHVDITPSTAPVFSLPMANNAMQNKADLTAPSILAH